MATTTPRVTIYVRHSAGCKYGADEFAKRCDCRKWLRWTQDGIRNRRKTETRSWDEAEQAKRDLEDRLSGKAPEEETDKGITAAVAVFIADKKVQGVTSDTLAKYTRELGRLVAYCDRASVFTVQSVTRELLTRFCGTWEPIYPSSQTRSVVRARLRTFLRYCYESQWTPRIPALPKITVDVVPTMPLTDDEYEALLTATVTLKDIETRQRSRALFRLMRHTGLAVGDSLKLLKARMSYDKSIERWRVETARQKTGTHVSVIIPTDLAEELRALPTQWVSSSNGLERKISPKYFFWDGKSDIVNTWTRKTIPKCFKAAGIEKFGNMTSHRLRDTFACDLLQKGVPLEDVAKLLGHKSIKTTERSYAKWVKGRQDRLDNLVMDALNT